MQNVLAWFSLIEKRFDRETLLKDKNQRNT